MNAPGPHNITLEDLSAFLDGELPEDRCAAIEAACKTDASLAAQLEAFAQDREMLARSYAPVAHAPLPQAWLDRIESAVIPPSRVLPVRAPAPLAQSRAASRPGLGRRRAAAWAIAACLALFVAAAGIWQIAAPEPDVILREAYAARAGSTPAVTLVADPATTPEPAQRGLLRLATNLPLQPPDLRRLGWQLTALRTYRGAAQLSYANAKGAILTMYVRPSAGAPRFDLLRKGKLRVCVWQDDVVGAVIIGDMSAGQMMRVAGAAYDHLDF